MLEHPDAAFEERQNFHDILHERGVRLDLDVLLGRDYGVCGNVDQFTLGAVLPYQLVFGEEVVIQDY